MLPPHRLIVALTAAATAAVTLSAGQAGPTVRITSPVSDALLTGPVRLVAAIEPAAVIRQIKEVTFYADGLLVCKVARPPFECEWDAGDRIVRHVIRVAASLPSGRITDSVETREVSYSESVDVDVVQVTVVVKDDDGRFVSDLKLSDFKVYDNDKPQPITSLLSENIPLEMVVALDVSSSMREALPQVREASKRFLAGLNPNDQVTLLAFNDMIWPLAHRSKDQEVRVKAIDRMAPWGGTALYDVVIDSLNRLGRQSGRRSVLLFSDGDDQSSHAALEAAVSRAEGSDATIYVIGQGRAIRTRDLQSILKRFADISGGRAFFTDDTSRLDQYFEEIIEDLRHQYLLSYPAPTQERDGQWHTIRVEVEGKKVRAREGYRLIKN
jgi:VWFA-related protein